MVYNIANVEDWVLLLEGVCVIAQLERMKETWIFLEKSCHLFLVRHVYMNAVGYDPQLANKLGVCRPIWSGYLRKNQNSSIYIYIYIFEVYWNVDCKSRLTITIWPHTRGLRDEKLAIVKRSVCRWLQTINLQTMVRHCRWPEFRGEVSQ